MTSSSSTFSAGAAALQPDGASASGASGGLPSARVAERAESFVATLESGDYDSDRGENESMLLYTKRPYAVQEDLRRRPRCRRAEREVHHALVGRERRACK